MTTPKDTSYEHPLHAKPRLADTRHLFRHPPCHRHLGKHEAQERQQPVLGRTFVAVASHRILDVGHQRRAIDAHCQCQCRLHHRHRLRQLRMVRLCLHRTVGICLRPTLFRSQHQHAAGIHGTAFWTIHPQHPCVVHHRHHHHLLACPHPLCRRHTHPPGVRHPHVAVGAHPASHLRLLHHDGRSESRGIHQRISDVAVDNCFRHTNHRRASPCGRCRRIGLQGAE